MTGTVENAFINVKNRSKTITAEVEIPQGGANGVILCQGSRFGRGFLAVGIEPAAKTLIPPRYM